MAKSPLCGQRFKGGALWCEAVLRDELPFYFRDTWERERCLVFSRCFSSQVSVDDERNRKVSECRAARDGGHDPVREGAQTKQLLCAVQLAHWLRPRSTHHPPYPQLAWLVDVNSRAVGGAQGDGMAQEAAGRRR